MKNINNHRAKVIAFYLPQFHPIAENDNWWGKGFTEWTNVAKAKPLFHNHYQPKVPADLGFYDLRVPEIRQQQAQLAREAGVDAFCYWHYWLGGGKQLMEYPLQEVVKSKNPDFPFCLGWANHTWYKKAWNSSVSRFSQEKLIEQTYPVEDIDKHFHTMLPMFQDDRYYRLHNKLVFLIYDPLSIPYLKEFMERWQDLATQYSLPGFYFIAQVDANTIKKDYSMFDAVNYDCIRNLFTQGRPPGPLAAPRTAAGSRRDAYGRGGPALASLGRRPVPIGIAGRRAATEPGQSRLGWSEAGGAAAAP